MRRQIEAGALFLIAGLAIAYVLMTAYLNARLPQEIGYTYLLTDLRALARNYPDLFTHVWASFLLLGAAGAAAGAHLATEDLTRQGTSTWQTLAQMRRNKMLGAPGKGFLLAKTSKPEGNGRYITSESHPNCLVIAPTGAGKGVGFVYPNLLTFEGSTITLDIKGENYATTARWRQKMGDKVYKFAPVQFSEGSFRYNPLERIGRMKKFAQVQFELRKIATLFLQADRAGEWLNGAIQLFTAIGCVAYERGDLTLGGIHKILAEGEGDLVSHIHNLSKTVKEPSLQRELSSLSMLDKKALSSYLSVMNNAGFDLWSNPHVADMTSHSDFSFHNLRRERTSIYFVVSDGDLEPMAGLVRLFFNELVSTIQQSKPGADEPHKVMLILDEFHRLGKMSKVAEAMTTIRGFNGRIAIITQTIPKLDAIYSYEERLSIQGGAGLKLYMTPSDEMTIEDLSKACGMTTKRMVSKSRRGGLGEKTTYSERSEERPLLTEDEARRLPEDAAIVIVNGKQPIKVKAIKHFKDSTFKRIMEDQEKLSWESIERQLTNVHIERAEQRAEAAEQAAQRAEQRAEAAEQAAQRGELVRKAGNDRTSDEDKAVPAPSVEAVIGKSREDLTPDDLAKMKSLSQRLITLLATVEKMPNTTTASAPGDGAEAAGGPETSNPPKPHLGRRSGVMKVARISKAAFGEEETGKDTKAA